jgi:hypothetical protein
MACCGKVIRMLDKTAELDVIAEEGIKIDSQPPLLIDNYEY